MQASKTKRVLVVDDEPMLRNLLKRVLTSLPQKIEVSEAEDGAQALSCLESQTFDLVLLDVKMPIMNGLEALSRIRENESTKDLTVLLLTSEHQAEDIYKGREAGATAYLTKPFDVSDITELLKAHFAGDLL